MAEINFKYSDCDKHSVEMAELYTYSEMDDFSLNHELYSKYMDERGLSLIWITKTQKEKNDVLQDLIQRIESANSEIRLQAARILLYILQVFFFFDVVVVKLR